jgi:ABC-type Zn uptake system ZnuABC Zn-binding protein ZnuA
MKRRFVLSLVLVAGLLVACGGAPASAPRPGSGTAGVNVLAVETFLADIAQNVAGDRLSVGALLPVGVDPHSFEPAPADVARVARSTVLIVNGAGFEAFLDRLLKNAGGTRTVIEASAGLAPRTQQQSEAPSDHAQGDPHFWLDPMKTVTYVTNIRAALTTADPSGATIYAANADAYTKKLVELDAWISAQVEQVPVANRLLVTNHESLGYFADRYGFTVVGSIVASVSSSASPSAQELAQLVTSIRQAHARAVFLEKGANGQMARQLAQDTGVAVVDDLYTHSISSGSPAPTYIDMMTYNTRRIVDALK